MKKFFKWLIRIICILIICAAAGTFAYSFLHRNDDHSEAALLGVDAVPEIDDNTGFEPGTAVTLLPQTLGATEEEQAQENATITVYSDGEISANRPTVTVTAAFGDINNSIEAELTWYLNDEVIWQEEKRLLVEGSTVNCDVTVDVNAESEGVVTVTLEAAYGGKTISGSTEVPVEWVSSDDQVVIQTEEITVTALKSAKLYADYALTSELGTMDKNETGLLIAYETLENKNKALLLQLEDGSTGWINASNVKITDENCTVDDDYTEEAKVDFVNSMGYDSQSNYMIWVSLYTQKVNVFKGVEGNWKLVECFDCATGVNSTPTTTGSFFIKEKSARWTLGNGDTYVAPVLIFNGGEAFTSQPYYSKNDEVADDTMGEPASGGSVRLLKDDIEWLNQNIPVETLVVVY